MPPVSMSPVANFAAGTTGVMETGGKFANDVNDTGGKLPPVSATLAVNLPVVLIIRTFSDCVQHVTGTGSGLLGGIPRVVVQISALTLKGPL